MGMKCNVLLYVLNSKQILKSTSMLNVSDLEWSLTHLFLGVSDTHNITERLWYGTGSSFVSPWSLEIAHRSFVNVVSNFGSECECVYRIYIINL